jgi:hypothetical protein
MPNKIIIPQYKYLVKFTTIFFIYVKSIKNKQKNCCYGSEGGIYNFSKLLAVVLM